MALDPSHLLRQAHLGGDVLEEQHGRLDAPGAVQRHHAR